MKCLGGSEASGVDLAIGRSVLPTPLRPTAVRLRLRRGDLNAGLKPRSTSGAKEAVPTTAEASLGEARGDLRLVTVRDFDLPSAEWSPP